MPFTPTDRHEPPERTASADPVAPLGERIATGVAIVVPFVGVVAVATGLWGSNFGWTALGLFAGMYLLSAIGVTVGFHRLFAHHSFETYRWVQFVLVALGSMAVQWSVMKWVAQHRRHHRHSDTPDDPHSPHHHGHGVRGVLRGAWHAHIGWLFAPDPPGLYDTVRDLQRNRTVRVASALWPLWVVLGFALPAVVGGLVEGSWAGAWAGIVWGGLVRIFLVHHVTWSVNSACHLWGRQPFRSTDASRNNLLFGILAMGEGWHNGHHAFPTSARHGLRWWELDASYLCIRFMKGMGLAWEVRVPAPKAVDRARRATSEVL